MKLFITPLFLILTYSIMAQNPLSQQVQTEFGLGISLPFLNSGKELLQSENIRNSGLSYFQNGQTSRKNVGNYGRLVGWSLEMAYYLPLKNVKGLMLGSTVRSSLTGTQPSVGGYEEGYFFNFISVGFSAKYYPFTKNNVFIKGDFGLAVCFYQKQVSK